MKKLLALTCLTTLAFHGVMETASARDLGDSMWSKERFQIRARAIGVLPDSGGSTTIGGTPHADEGYSPEIDLTYFMTEHVALELIAATTPHDLTLNNSTLGYVDLGETMLLPPILSLQYHFTPDNKFSPYVGVGVNYTLPYNEKAAGGAVTKLQVDGSFGYSFQAGADYWVNDHWGINLDVKKLYVNVDTSINSGAIKGNVELDPWIVGAGVSYRF